MMRFPCSIDADSQHVHGKNDQADTKRSTKPDHVMARPKGLNESVGIAGRGVLSGSQLGWA